MDPITHSFLGATWAVQSSSMKNKKIGYLIGSASAMMPDLDVVLRSNSDPLMAITYHRHFTHSFAFVPLGGLIAALLMYPIFKKQISFRLMYLYAFIGYATHSFLDACTSYGTQIFLPFSPERVSWNNVAIIDLFYTVPLAILLFWGLRKRENESKSRVFISLAMIYSVVYLLFGVYKRDLAYNYIKEMAEKRADHVKRVMVFPTFGNLSLWRTVYETMENRLVVDAVNVNFTGSKKTLYSGAVVEKLDLNSLPISLNNTPIPLNDIKKFIFFTQDLTYLTKYNDQWYIADLRYSAVPNETIPMWALKVPTKNQITNQHLTFERLSMYTDENLKKFWDML